MRTDRKLLFICLLCLTLAACANKPSKQLETTEHGAYSAALSPNGQYVVVGSVDKGGSLWRLQDGTKLYDWNHAKGGFSNIIAATFSTDSKFALTAEKARMVLWNVANGHAMGFWPVNGGVEALALSDNGRYALVGQANYSAIYVDLATGSILQTLPHNDKVTAVAISADGKVGVTGGADNVVKVWDLPKGKVTFAYRMGDNISAVALSNDARYVFAAQYYGKAKIWDVKTGHDVATLGYQRATVTCARFASDDKTLLTGFSARQVALWDVTSGKRLQNWLADPPFFWRRSGLVVVDVAFGSIPGQILNVFSNGLVDWWQTQ